MPFVSELRLAYNGVRASEAVTLLPPGVASDADIKLALSGFPPENANGKHIASFLKGLAKLEEQQAEFAEFKSTYISDNGTERGMFQAWKNRAPKSAAPKTNGNETAPESALNYLRKNPQAIDQFEAKYGYRPEGF